MKKRTKIISALLMSALILQNITGTPANDLKIYADSAAITEIPGTVKTEESINGSFLSVSGFAKGNISDRSMYGEDSSEYRTVSTPYEFFQAINDAQNGLVKVIEITNDLNLGWLELDDNVKNDFPNMIEAYTGSLTSSATPVSNPVLIESGISCVTFNNIDGLTIFSKNGSSIRHAEIKFNSGVNDVAIRNLNFDEVWEWDDWRPSGFGSYGGHGNHKRTGWSFIKINGCNNVWIDHCSFGIAFDGNIDIENGSSGITISWCTFGDTDTSQSSMIYRTAQYLEAIYQQSKTDSSVSSFAAYGIMRDNGMSVEQIMQYMGFHSKCHLVGSGDKDTWYYPVLDADGNIQYDPVTGLIIKEADTSKTNANERLRLSLAYNQYTNMGQRVPMIRGGVGHLYNCYINDMSFAEISNVINSDPKGTGKTIRKQIEEAGGTVVLLTRGMDARDEASIAADTCVYYGSSEPIVGSEFQDSDRSNLNGAYAGYFGYNHALIVNSSVQKYGEDSAYVGSSWDNNGNNPFVAYKWYDHSTIGNFSWGQEGDSLSYDYKTFPLTDVKTNTDAYSGSGKLDMTNKDWTSISYSDDFKIKTVDKSSEIPIENISLNKTKAKLYIDKNEYLQLTEQLVPSNATLADDTLTWTSADESVASVSESGLVTPKNYGTTTITVTTNNGLKAECKVSVEKSVSSIKINAPENIHVGDEFYLTADILPADVDINTVKWGVSGGKLQLLDADTGLVRAIAAGTATVYATSNQAGNRIGEKPLIEKTTLKISESSSNLSGDTNLDGKVDLTDASDALKAALNIITLSDDAIKAADIDGDGKVSLSDTLDILKIALGIM